MARIEKWQNGKDKGKRNEYICIKWEINKILSRLLRVGQGRTNKAAPKANMPHCSFYFFYNGFILNGERVRRWNNFVGEAGLDVFRAANFSYFSPPLLSHVPLWSPPPRFSFPLCVSHHIHPCNPCIHSRSPSSSSPRTLTTFFRADLKLPPTVSQFRLPTFISSLTFWHFLTIFYLMSHSFALTRFPSGFWTHMRAARPSCCNQCFCTPLSVKRQKKHTLYIPSQSQGSRFIP